MEIIDKRDPIHTCKCCWGMFYKEDLNEYGLCFNCANGNCKAEEKQESEYEHWFDI
jgi:hypothetical protein